MSILSKKADFFSRTSCMLLNKKEKYYARNTIQKPDIFLWTAQGPLLEKCPPPLPCQVHTVFEICESAAAAARPEF